MSTFQYSKLHTPDSFRLFELFPGVYGDPIHCRIFESDLNTNPSYTAISYCWGNPIELREIQVQEESLRISRTLRNALHYVRDETRSRVFWADQICINQADIAERGHQVNVMGRIFKGAKNVSVYLTGSNARIDRTATLESISDIDNMIAKELAEFGHFGKIPTVSQKDFHMYEGFNWKLLKEIFSCPWFDRTWVIQEVGLAQEVVVHYGGVTINWETLMKIAGWAAGPASTLYFSFHNKVSTMWQLWTSFDKSREILNSYSPSFLEIFHLARSLKATDSRDKIYAFLSHPAGEGSGLAHAVEPHYDWPLKDVYIDFVFKFMEHTRRSTILNYASGQWSPISELPSWCPKWDFEERDYFTPLDLDGQFCWYNTSFNSPFEFQKVGVDQLQLKGFIFDSLDYRHSSFHTKHFQIANNASGHLNGVFLEYLERAVDLYLESSSKNQNIWKALSLTLTAGNWREMTRRAEGKHEQRHFAEFATFICGRLDSGNDVNQQTWERFHGFEEVKEAAALGFKAEDFLNNAEMACDRRRLGITRRGHLMLGPEIAETGDLVCVVFGAKTPYVFRRLTDGTYQYIGDCYVHGIMDGEAMMLLKDGTVKEQSFTLR